MSHPLFRNQKLKRFLATCRTQFQKRRYRNLLKYILCLVRRYFIFLMDVVVILYKIFKRAPITKEKRVFLTWQRKYSIFIYSIHRSLRNMLTGPMIIFFYSLPGREVIVRKVSLKYSKDPKDEKIFFLPGREGILRIVSLKYSKEPTD
jgi:hypothetical protein